MNVVLEPSWKKILTDEFTKPYFTKLAKFVRTEYLSKTIFPQPKKVFSAFHLCPFDKVKVVIVGQDPYHTPDQAMGLAFSVPKQAPLQPSLQNIFKEMYDDLNTKRTSLPSSGDLTYLAHQGVFLLNATLTVEAHKAGSHQKKGWEEFTDAVIWQLSNERENIVFLLWGNYAKQKGAQIDRKKHLVLVAPHPSPFSANNGFFGCKHFSKTNEYLRKHGKKEIKWIL